jgi:hypothetical protein
MKQAAVSSTARAAGKQRGAGIGAKVKRPPTEAAFLVSSGLHNRYIGDVNHVTEYGFDALSKGVAFFGSCEVTLILSTKEGNMPRGWRTG